MIQEIKKENFDLKLRLYMEQKEREVSVSVVQVVKNNSVSQTQNIEMEEI